MLSEPLTRSQVAVGVGSVGVAAVAAVVAALRRVAAGVKRDPWPPDLDSAVRDAAAVPLCVNCLCPQPERSWFCPNCDFPVGECVACMPYLYIFLLGETLRRGVTGPPERSLCRTAFFTLLSLSQYTGFAVVYWYWMGRKARGRPIGGSGRRDRGLIPESPLSEDHDF